MKKELFISIKIYVTTWVVTLVLLLILLLQRETLKESISSLGKLLTYTPFLISVQVLFVIFYAVFLILRYFIRVYRNHGVKTMGKQAVFRLVIPVVIIFGVFKSIVYANSNEDFTYQWDHTIENNSKVIKDRYQTDGKHRGMSVFGWGNDDNDKPINTLVHNNVEWVAVIPFLYQKDERTVAMGTPKTIGKWSARDSMHIKAITELQEKGMHIQLKPHLWTRGWVAIKYQTKKH